MWAGWEGYGREEGHLSAAGLRSFFCHAYKYMTVAAPGLAWPPHESPNKDINKTQMERSSSPATQPAALLARRNERLLMALLPKTGLLYKH